MDMLKTMFNVWRITMGHPTINSGHYAGFAYKGLEPYGVEHRVRIGTLRCEFQRQQGVLLNRETTVLLVTGYI